MRILLIFIAGRELGKPLVLASSYTMDSNILEGNLNKLGIQELLGGKEQWSD